MSLLFEALDSVKYDKQNNPYFEPKDAKLIAGKAAELNRSFEHAAKSFARVAQTFSTLNNLNRPAETQRMQKRTGKGMINHFNSGYSDGRDHDNLKPSSKRPWMYRHGWHVGRYESHHPPRNPHIAECFRFMAEMAEELDRPVGSQGTQTPPVVAKNATTERN